MRKQIELGRLTSIDRLSKKKMTAEERAAANLAQAETESFKQMISDIYAGKYNDAPEVERKSVASRIFAYIKGLTARQLKKKEEAVTDVEMMQTAAGTGFALKDLKAGVIRRISPTQTAEDGSKKSIKGKSENVDAAE